MGELVHILTALIGIENLFNMGICHDVLIFPLIKLLRGIDKVNITIGAVLFENDNCRRNTGVKENISRQTDNRINGTFFQQSLTNGPFSITTEEHPVR